MGEEHFKIFAEVVVDLLFKRFSQFIQSARLLGDVLEIRILFTFHEDDVLIGFPRCTLNESNDNLIHPAPSEVYHFPNKSQIHVSPTPFKVENLGFHTKKIQTLRGEVEYSRFIKIFHYCVWSTDLKRMKIELKADSLPNQSKPVEIDLPVDPKAELEDIIDNYKAKNGITYDMVLLVDGKEIDSWKSLENNPISATSIITLLKATPMQSLNKRKSSPIISKKLKKVQHPALVRDWLEMMKYSNPVPDEFSENNYQQALSMLVDANEKTRAGIKLEESPEAAYFVFQKMVHSYTTNAVYAKLNKSLREYRKRNPAKPTHNESEYSLVTYPEYVYLLNYFLKAEFIENYYMLKVSKYYGRVFRGVNLSSEEWEKYKVGEFVLWEQFTSTSVEEDRCFKGDTLFEIFIPKAIQAWDITLWSSCPFEKEVLLPAGSHFLVHEKKVDKNLCKISLKYAVDFIEEFSKNMSTLCTKWKVVPFEKESINLISSISTNSVSGFVKKDDVVTTSFFSKQDYTWVINGDGKEGFISKKYLFPLNDLHAGTEWIARQPTGAFLRRFANDSSEFMPVEIKNEEKVFLISYHMEYALIRTFQGSQGYILTKYLARI